MESTTVDVLPYDSLVKLEFSGAFYERLLNCAIATVQEKEDAPEERALIFKELETRQPANAWEERIYLLLAIIYEIDEQAAKQGVLKKETIDLPPTDSSPEASHES
jgi:hypothetical protein